MYGSGCIDLGVGEGHVSWRSVITPCLITTVAPTFIPPVRSVLAFCFARHIRRTYIYARVHFCGSQLEGTIRQGFSISYIVLIDLFYLLGLDVI